jgi:hypothetical protein
MIALTKFKPFAVLSRRINFGGLHVEDGARGISEGSLVTDGSSEIS